MIIPVRCFTCGKIIGDKWDKFKELIEKGVSKKDALDQLGLERYCCRTIFLTNVDSLEDILKFRVD